MGQPGVSSVEYPNGAKMALGSQTGQKLISATCARCAVRRAEMVPFSPKTNTDACGILKNGGNSTVEIKGQPWGVPGDIPKWCKNGPWMPNWPKVILATRMHEAGPDVLNERDIVELQHHSARL